MARHVMAPPPSPSQPAAHDDHRQNDHAQTHEETLRLDCGEHTLWGILCMPDAAAEPLTGVIIVVGGPQYRVGSHRQFVLLARRLAQEGHAVLRFDVRGMGDSDGLALPRFEDIDADITAAMSGMRGRLPGLLSIVLWGLCDGASAALMYLQRNPQAAVAGMCLANPWVRSAATQAQTTVKHYYKDRLRQRAFWVKLLKGGVAIKAARDLLSNLRQARQPAAPAARSPGNDARLQDLTFQSRMAQGWLGFGRPLLLLLSENDYTAKEFVEVTSQDPDWKGALHCPGLTRVELVGTDHTCSDAAGRLQLEDATARWLATALRGATHHKAPT